MLRGHLIIMGDMNIHMDNRTDVNAIKLHDILETMGLENHVEVPTHIHGHTLDLIISRKADDLRINNIETTYYVSDHSFVCAGTSLAKPDISYKTITYRKLRDIDMLSFKQDLQQSDLCVNASDNLDDLVNQYYDSICNVMNVYAPETTKTVKVVQNSPWFTQDLRELKLSRRKLEYKWRKSGLEVDHEAFKLARNDFICKVNMRKTSYYHDEVMRCNGDQKKLYTLVNKLTKSQQETPLPDHESKAELADNFGEFFVGKVEKSERILTM